MSQSTLNETEILKQSLAQGAILQNQLQNLLKTFRPLLDNPEFAKQMSEAESYLFDVQDALEDFTEDCSSCLDAWQGAQS